MGFSLKGTLTYVAVGLAAVFGWNTCQYKYYENKANKVIENSEQEIDMCFRLKEKEMPSVVGPDKELGNDIRNRIDSVAKKKGIEFLDSRIEKLAVDIQKANYYLIELNDLSEWDILFGYYRSFDKFIS